MCNGLFYRYSNRLVDAFEWWQFHVNEALELSLRIRCFQRLEACRRRLRSVATQCTHVLLTRRLHCELAFRIRCFSLLLAFHRLLRAFHRRLRVEAAVRCSDAQLNLFWDVSPRRLRLLQRRPSHTHHRATGTWLATRRYRPSKRERVRRIPLCDLYSLIKDQYNTFPERSIDLCVWIAYNINESQFNLDSTE